MIQSLGKEVAQWEALSRTVTAHLADMPHATVDHAALEQGLARLKQLADEQDLLIARLRENLRFRAEEVQRVRDLRNRLVALLQGRFGLRSEMLHQFGVKPRKRRSTATTPGEPTAPTGTAGPTQPTIPGPTGS